MEDDPARGVQLGEEIEVAVAVRIPRAGSARPRERLGSPELDRAAGPQANDQAVVLQKGPDEVLAPVSVEVDDGHALRRPHEPVCVRRIEFLGPPRPGPEALRCS